MDLEQYLTSHRYFCTQTRNALLSKFLLTARSDKQIYIVFIIAITTLKLYVRNMGELVGPLSLPKIHFYVTNPLSYH